MFLSWGLLQAQDYLYLGVQMGPAYANLHPMNIENVLSTSPAGRQMGLFLRYGKRPYYHLGVNWGRARDAVMIENGTMGAVQDEIPIRTFGMTAKIGYNVLNNPRFRWRASTGPHLGRARLFSSENIQFSNESVRCRYWAWQVGTGVDIFHFNLDIGYNFALQPLDAGIEQNLGLDLESSMRMVVVEIGVHL